MKVVGWRLYYGDGTTVDSGQSSWADAPDENVQVLMLFHEKPYRTVVAGEDNYKLPRSRKVKKGKEIDEKEFYRIYIEVAMKDMEWPAGG